MSEQNERAKKRRVPSQDRSRERARRILDAAAAVFAEVGFDTATMDGIAARAETSIGSLYQFFPNKAAIFDAVAAEYLDHARTLFDAILTDEALARPWEELMDGFIDAFVAFHRSELGFRAVFQSMRLSPAFVRGGDALNREFAKRAERVLKREAPGLTPARRAVVATTIIEVASGMLLFSSRCEPALAKRVIEETKLVLRRYVAPYAATKMRNTK